MKLLITGGTGFIGVPLCDALLQHGHDLLVLTRSPQTQPARPGIRLLPLDTDEWPRAMGWMDGVINLAGESLAGARWSVEQKRRIRESRVETTRRVVEAIAAAPTKPSVLINASAIGYYGPRADEELTETDSPGRGFLAETCLGWEREAQRAEQIPGIRVVRLRIGLVLGPGGGALSKMVPPFRWWIGGPLGSGRQWVSWIHLDDVIGLVEHLLTQPGLAGPVNATAPHPVTMATLCRELGRALHRPSWAPVPGAVLRLLLGEMADLLLTGQRVLPRAAQQAGFRFRFAELPEALTACLK